MKKSLPPGEQYEAGAKKITRRRHLAAILIILGVALLLRFSFLKTPQVPVVWDAAGYHIQAKTFLSAFSRFSDRSFFNREFRRAYDMASFKGEVYPLFLSLVYALSGVRTEVVRAAQAILDSLMCALIYLLAWHICRKQVVGIIAGLFSAFYLPFIFSSGRILTETLGIFLITLMVWLLYRGLSRRGWVEFFLAGLVCALVMICRTMFQYIVPLVLVGLYLSMRGRKIGRRAALLAVYLSGVCLLIIPRLYYTAEIYDRPLLSGSWRNGEAVYAGIHPFNQGFQTEVLDITSELREAVKSRSGSRRIEQGDYYRAYLLTVLRQPLRSLAIIAGKGFSFWKRPYNDFMQSFLFPENIFSWLHRSIFILALFGIALSFRYWPRNALLLAVLFYLAGMSLLADMEIRYGLPAVPFLIILSSLSLYFLGRGIGEIRRKKKLGKFLWLTGSCVFLGLLWRFASLSTLKEIIPASGTILPRGISLALMNLFWLSLIPLIYFLGRTLFPVRFSWFLACFPVVLIGVAVNSYSEIHPYWHEWRARLTTTDQIIRQVIEIPADIEKYRKAEIKIDMQGGGGDGFNLFITVDGEVVRHFQRGLTMDWEHYIRTRKAFSVYLKHHRRKLEDLKQWFTVLLPVEKLLGKKQITVDMSLSFASGGGGDCVEVFGDCIGEEKPRQFEGPSWSRKKTRLSAYKYAVEDDWRIWERCEIPSPVTSSFYDGREWNNADLSPSPGKQDGRYRIFLVPSREKISAEVMPRDLLTERRITDRVATPAHRIQIWMILPDRKESNRIKVEASHALPGEEGGFFLVAYADTDGDGLPDRRLGRSSFLTGSGKDDWSEWEFSSDEKVLFVGNCWGKPTPVYYGHGEWTNDLFSATMYYANRPDITPRLTVSPKITNLRVTFLKPE